MSEENVFLRLVKEGKIEFTQDGKIIAFNEHIIQLPVRVLNKLLVLLKENFGENKAQEIMKELGRFQVKQAFQRYLKTLGWKELPKDRIWEFVRQIFLSIGLGKYEVKKINNAYSFSISKTPFAEEYLLEYEKQEGTIDYYIAGGIETFLTALLGKPMACEEVKCYAKGDDCCEFIVKPKEEIETKS
jgi:predicted hydrocarbon binding protein